MDGAEDLEPAFDEVGAAGVAEDDEAAVFMVGGQDAADELVGVDLGGATDAAVMGRSSDLIRS